MLRKSYLTMKPVRSLDNCLVSAKLDLVLYRTQCSVPATRVLPKIRPDRGGRARVAPVVTPTGGGSTPRRGGGGGLRQIREPKARVLGPKTWPLCGRQTALDAKRRKSSVEVGSEMGRLLPIRGFGGTTPLTVFRF